MNIVHDSRSIESKMADIDHQKSKSNEKLQALVDENNAAINAMMMNRNDLASVVPQIDAGTTGLRVLFDKLSLSSKKLTPAQRNRLLRSINNAMNAIGSLKKDIGSITFDCSMQASALKYKNDGLKRDLSRRKIG